MNLPLFYHIWKILRWLTNFKQLNGGDRVKCPSAGKLATTLAALPSVLCGPILDRTLVSSCTPLCCAVRRVAYARRWRAMLMCAVAHAYWLEGCVVPVVGGLNQEPISCAFSLPGWWWTPRFSWCAIAQKRGRGERVARWLIRRWTSAPFSFSFPNP